MADGDQETAQTIVMGLQRMGVDIGTIRRWHRRGLIKPARMVRRLPYFDFQEVATARETERGTRADDKRSETAMEDRKKEGYF